MSTPTSHHRALKVEKPKFYQITNTSDIILKGVKCFCGSFVSSVQNQAKFFSKDCVQGVGQLFTLLIIRKICIQFDNILQQILTFICSISINLFRFVCLL